MKEEESEDNEEEPSEEKSITIDRTTIHFPLPHLPPPSHHNNTSLVS